jgi:membrane-bound lytic murein transglycosylase B
VRRTRQAPASSCRSRRPPYRGPGRRVPRFVEGLWPEAKARGVSRATFDEAFRGVLPDAKIIALTKKQSEFVRPIWDYINGAISAQRLQRGRRSRPSGR